eukprot:GHVU01195476.1.p1 GENE.GHVU01195476.1~~GHVU01195476.1.p1  ORF type:complete len:203 (+),score=37.01 GHVU01195476.1:633-1241(+)
MPGAFRDRLFEETSGITVILYDAEGGITKKVKKFIDALLGAEATPSAIYVMDCAVSEFAADFPYMMVGDKVDVDELALPAPYLLVPATATRPAVYGIDEDLIPMDVNQFLEKDKLHITRVLNMGAESSANGFVKDPDAYPDVIVYDFASFFQREKEAILEEYFRHFMHIYGETKKGNILVRALADLTGRMDGLVEAAERATE